DTNDPIADASRAILDGHIVLDRQLAESGIFPAIDVESSISRAMNEITDAGHQQLVRRYRQVHAAYRQNEDLIAVGAYRKGSDPRIDEAVALRPGMLDFIRQDSNRAVSLRESLTALERIMTGSSEERDAGT